MKALILLALLALTQSGFSQQPSPRKTMIMEHRDTGALSHVALVSKTATHVTVMRNRDDAVFTVAIKDLTDSNQEAIASWRPEGHQKSKTEGHAGKGSAFAPSVKLVPSCPGGVCRP